MEAARKDTSDVAEVKEDASKERSAVLARSADPKVQDSGPPATSNVYVVCLHYL
jgi:hypothetical protein